MRKYPLRVLLPSLGPLVLPLLFLLLLLQSGCELEIPIVEVPEYIYYCNIEGNVRSVADNLPIEGVRIEIEHPGTHLKVNLKGNQTAYSDQSGNYLLSGSANLKGKFEYSYVVTLRITKSGFNEMTDQVLLTRSDNTVRVDYVLIPAGWYEASIDILERLEGVWSGYSWLDETPAGSVMDSLTLVATSDGEIHGFNHASLCSCNTHIRPVFLYGMTYMEGSGSFDQTHVRWLTHFSLTRQETLCGELYDYSNNQRLRLFEVVKK